MTNGRYKLGSVPSDNGTVAVYGHYRHGSGTLPSLCIRGGGMSKDYIGSSLGPVNHACSPDVDDVVYWQSLAGLPADEKLARRVVAGHQSRY